MIVTIRKYKQQKEPLISLVFKSLSKQLEIMRKLFFFLLFVLMNSCSEPSKPNELPVEDTSSVQTNGVITVHEIDSIIDDRLRYIIDQFGDTAIFEKFYGRTVESVKKEFVQIYQDSLMNQ